MRGWLHVNIGPRIFLGFTFAALPTLAVALVSISYLRSVGQDLSTLADQDRLLQTNALELRIAVAEESDGVRGYLLSGDTALLEPFSTGQSNFATTANELRGLVESEEDTRLLAEAESLHLMFLDIAEEQVTLHDQGFPEAAVFLWQRQGSEIKASLDDTLAEFITRQDETIAVNTQNAEAEQNQALAISLGLVGIALVMGIAGGIWISRSITKPLAHLAKTATEIADGNLMQVATVERNDEIGILAGAFNSMTSQLRGLIGSLEQRVADRTRELRTLEELGRAIINAPPDASTLPELLTEYVPAMFPDCQAEVRIFPDRTILCCREGVDLGTDSLWAWVTENIATQYFSQGEILPWLYRAAPSSVIVAPILDVETKEPIGAVVLSCRREPDAPSSLLPAVQSLSAQIASAFEGARRHGQEVAHEKVARELALAGQIQASFLPDHLPEVPGWQLAAMLQPARETSGDFYDVISLPSGRLGVLIADVADKGMGAALYMALSRTLIRTYAIEYDTQPELALDATNHRIMADSNAGLFVTVFYAVLDPTSGELRYANAGHNPPYLLRSADEGTVVELDRTGVPLGILDDQHWQQKVVNLAPSDVLLLYTDGVTEAQNAEGEFFDEERLRNVVLANRTQSATGIRDSIVNELQVFVADSPQFDDVTMMVVARDSNTNGENASP